MHEQRPKQINLTSKPERIISLVPSQTELLVDLGAEDLICGVTKFCIHPDHIRKKVVRVGGTKKYDFAKIEALKPDLIIGNKEENERLQIEALAEKYPVWISDIQNLDDALEMINTLGEITGTSEKASEINKRISQGFADIQPLSQPLRTAYLIWRNPWMGAGHDTFIDHIMQRLGMINILSDRKSRYPEFTPKELIDLKPELILLSSEPYPFKNQHINEIRTFCPNAKFKLVDGEMFSWYGSRLIKSAEYLKNFVEELGSVR